MRSKQRDDIQGDLRWLQTEERLQSICPFILQGKGNYGVVIKS